MNKEKLLKDLKRYNFPENILQAVKNVKREEFIEKRLEPYAYEDSPLPIGKQATISQPYTICFILQLLEIKNKQKILEIGSGSGYVLTLIHNIFQKNQLYGIEIQEKIAKNAEKRLINEKNINIINQDGKNGLKEKAPFDRILMSASCINTPLHLLKQLKKDGIIVFPNKNCIVKIKKKDNKIIEQEYPGFLFVPLQ